MAAPITRRARARVLYRMSTISLLFFAATTNLVDRYVVFMYVVGVIGLWAAAFSEDV